MKLFTAFALITSLTQAQASSEKNSSLRGWSDFEDLSFDFSEWKCTIEAFSDEDKCADAVTSDGEPCNFCSVDSQGQSAGLCVTPELADKMEDMSPGISCGDEKKKFTSLRKRHPTKTEHKDMNFDWSEWKCTVEAFSDEEKCADSLTADGEDCDYCTIGGDDEGGLCVTPSLADKMEQVNPQVECSVPDIQEPETQTNVDFDWSEWKCTVEAFSDEEKCADSLTADGDACDYCTIGGDDEGGLCVTPSLADKMEQVNPQVECSSSLKDTNSLAKERTPIKSEYECSVTAFTDPETCLETITGDGESCEFCSLDGPFGPQGICVSPDQADVMKERLPLFKCSSDANLDKSPITDCNLSGANIDLCLDPSKVNGSECIWCDAGIGGFCFPKSWEENASRFLDCTDSLEAKIQRAASKYDLDSDVLGSSCLKQGFTGSSPDDCRDSIDDESGEHCVFCSSPNLDGLGICMPSTFKGKESRFYTCDAQGEITSII